MHRRSWINWESLADHCLAHSISAYDREASSVQLTMFTPLSQKILDRLKEADLNHLTPIEALNLLNEMKKQIG